MFRRSNLIFDCFPTFSFHTSLQISSPSHTVGPLYFQNFSLYPSTCCHVVMSIDMAKVWTDVFSMCTYQSHPDICRDTQNKLQCEMHMHAIMQFATGGILVFTCPNISMLNLNFGISMQRCRIMERFTKHVICIKNVRAATACMNIYVKWWMGPRYLLQGVFCTMLEDFKKALAFSDFVKAL